MGRRWPHRDGVVAFRRAARGAGALAAGRDAAAARSRRRGAGVGRLSRRHDRALRQRPLPPRVPGPRPDVRDLGRDRGAPAVRRAGAEPGAQRGAGSPGSTCRCTASTCGCGRSGRPACSSRTTRSCRISSPRPRRRSMRSTGRRRPRTTSPASRRSRASRRSGSCRRSRTIPPALTEAQRQSVIDADAALVDDAARRCRSASRRRARSRSPATRISISPGSGPMPRPAARRAAPSTPRCR